VHHLQTHQGQRIGLTATHKLEHDAQQLEYLLGRGLLPRGFHPTVTALRRIVREMRLHPPQPGERRLVQDVEQGATSKAVSVSVPKGGGYISLHKGQIGTIATWRRLAYLDPAPSVLPRASLALRPPGEARRLEEAYLRDDVIYMDNLLTPEALGGLRKFCLESCAWHQEKSLGYY